MHRRLVYGVSSENWQRTLRGFLYRQVLATPELPIQYVDFAYWQRQWLQGARNAAGLLKQQLEGKATVLELPLIVHVRQFKLSGAHTKVGAAKVLTEAVKI